MKVLIISHNPITDYQNMGKTLLSIFKSFNGEELIQLYFYPTVPNIKKCSSYFRITDKDVLNNIFVRKDIGQEIPLDIIDANNTLYENNKIETLYKNKNNKKTIRRFIRDCVWFLGKWYSKNLQNWLIEEKPDLVFYAAGDSIFSYKIALKISNALKIPLFSYFCDDYFFYVNSKSIIYKLHHNFLKFFIKKVIKQSMTVITISDQLTKAYKDVFKKEKIITLMTGSNIKFDENKFENYDDLKISYLGNVGLKRNKNLVEIGQALKDINQRYKTNFKISLYTGETDKEILKDFNIQNCIELKDFVKGEDGVKDVMLKSTILLHVESFNKKMINRVKYSVSTKIADSLASGRCLVAYGPNNVSSFEHLINSKAAFIIDKKEELIEKLETILFDKSLRRCYAENGLILAEARHNSEKESLRLKKYIEKVLYEGNSN